MDQVVAVLSIYSLQLDVYR